jgi:hypothetical protein
MCRSKTISLFVIMDPQIYLSCVACELRLFFHKHRAHLHVVYVSEVGTFDSSRYEYTSIGDLDFK